MNADPAEIAKFSALAHRWWDPTSEFKPLHEINPQIPDGYEEVVAKCLSKDPARRYQRGKDLATALRAVIRGERPAAESALNEETVVTRVGVPVTTGERTPIWIIRRGSRRPSRMA